MGSWWSYYFNSNVNNNVEEPAQISPAGEAFIEENPTKIKCVVCKLSSGCFHQEAIKRHFYSSTNGKLKSPFLISCNNAYSARPFNRTPAISDNIERNSNEITIREEFVDKIQSKIMSTNKYINSNSGLLKWLEENCNVKFYILKQGKISKFICLRKSEKDFSEDILLNIIKEDRIDTEFNPGSRYLLKQNSTEIQELNPNGDLSEEILNILQILRYSDESIGFLSWNLPVDNNSNNISNNVIENMELFNEIKETLNILSTIIICTSKISYGIQRTDKSTEEKQNLTSTLIFDQFRDYIHQLNEKSIIHLSKSMNNKKSKSTLGREIFLKFDICACTEN